MEPQPSSPVACSYSDISWLGSTKRQTRIKFVAFKIVTPKEADGLVLWVQPNVLDLG
jgi:hypothetical protein